MNTYTLKILLPDKIIYNDKIASVTAECEDGQISVFSGHEPMIAKLVEGSLTVRTKEEMFEGTTGSGLLLVSRNEAAIMVRSFMWAGDDTGKEPTAQEPAQAAQELF